MAQQTALEWFEQEFMKGQIILPILFQQAKELEKEQIMDDFNAGQWAWAEHLNGKEKKDPLEYYNETYNYGRKL